LEYSKTKFTEGKLSVEHTAEIKLNEILMIDSMRNTHCLLKYGKEHKQIQGDVADD